VEEQSVSYILKIKRTGYFQFVPKAKEHILYITLSLLITLRTKSPKEAVTGEERERGVSYIL
jgi:hypothetical protein